MKALSVTFFKSHALDLIDKVTTTRENLIITKHGKNVVKIIPYVDAEKKIVAGRLSHVLIEEKDVVTPLGSEMWGAAKK